MIRTSFEDDRGGPLRIGGLVELAERGDFKRWAYTGRVVELLEADVDVDDEGRAYRVAPRMTVRFFDGVMDYFNGDVPSVEEAEEVASFGDVLAVGRVSWVRQAWWWVRGRVLGA